MNISFEMQILIDEAVERERAAIWDAINAQIKEGPLQGNGWDKTAERNGLILASNTVRERMKS